LKKKWDKEEKKCEILGNNKMKFKDNKDNKFHKTNLYLIDKGLKEIQYLYHYLNNNRTDNKIKDLLVIID